MARKFIIATHGNLASGYRSALGLLATDSADIEVVNCFTEEMNPKNRIAEIIESISENDEVIVFTDIMYGSINQICMHSLNEHKNIHVITGINLPLVCQIVLCAEEVISEKYIQNAIQLAKEEIKYVNREIEMENNSTNTQSETEETEEFFQ